MSRALKQATHTTSAELDWTPVDTFSDHTEVTIITCYIDDTPTDDEDMLVTLVSAAGSNYDCILRSWNPSEGATDNEKQHHVFQINQRFMAGNAIKVTYTNTGADNLYLTMEYDLNPNL